MARDAHDDLVACARLRKLRYQRVPVVGTVQGGDIYGRYPQMAIGGPDDCLSNSNPSSPARGAWLPSTSVDQYAATLGKWFGVDTANAAVTSVAFPNLAGFTSQGLPSDLGFMG